MAAKYTLYIKAGADGRSVGDCPFSQRAYMFMLLKIPHEDLTVVPVDITNKPQSFLTLNPEGKVPLLVDSHADKVVPDSSAICEYINTLYPEKDLKFGYQGPAVEACSQIFPKLAQLLKNRDSSATPELKQKLTQELQKFNDYLQNEKDQNKKFLLCDNLTDLDCAILAKLNHVRVAAKEYKNYEIPEEFVALHQYLKNGFKEETWRQTCPKDQDVIHGWSRHGVIKES